MIDKDRVKKAVREILIAIGEDPDREGIRETPDRVARMYEEIFSGIDKNAKTLAKIFYEEGADEPVVVKDIPIHSMCEHHILPFVGHAHVAYIPRDGKILGLSKIARMVECISNKLQLQERLTKEVLDVIQDTINPLGVLVLIEAEHMCMTMRGIKKVGSKTVTIKTTGILKEDLALRQEILKLVK
ncbi:MAG: GTP cyclohydrolase I FolE [Clostridiales bacterium]|nr:GTP cyclohydrolase I FolE [Clostridiales bacterium]